MASNQPLIDIPTLRDLISSTTKPTKIPQYTALTIDPSQCQDSVQEPGCRAPPRLCEHHHQTPNRLDSLGRRSQQTTHPNPGSRANNTGRSLLRRLPPDEFPARRRDTRWRRRSRRKRGASSTSHHATDDTVRLFELLGDEGPALPTAGRGCGDVHAREEES